MQNKKTGPKRVLPMKQVTVPWKHKCVKDGDGNTCISKSQYQVKKTTDSELIKHCLSNEHARVLVRYPRGQKLDEEFMEVFTKNARIMYSETFYINRPQLKNFLGKLYYRSHIRKDPLKMAQKLNETWNGQKYDRDGRLKLKEITIYVFQLYDPDKPNSIEKLKGIKKTIRSTYKTMHCLHTSDNQEETIYFANHVFHDSFLNQ